MTETFDHDYKFILPSTRQLEYSKGTKLTSRQWPRRKLLLEEISFFTGFWDSVSLPNPDVVYAGAAPGIHIPVIDSMFPGMVFHLYDELPFSPKLTGGVNNTPAVSPTYPNVNLHYTLFDANTAKEWVDKHDNVILISDIRSGYKLKEGELEKNQLIVKKEMEEQQTWVQIVDPAAAELKFRLWWPENNESHVEQIYLDGIVLQQPWKGPSSTECRLVPIKRDGKWLMARWDTREYQDQNFYINKVLRTETRFLNPFTGLDEPIDGDELTQDFDSCLEAVILGDYLVKVGEEVTPEKVIGLSRWITSVLSNKGTPNIASVRLRGKVPH